MGNGESSLTQLGEPQSMAGGQMFFTGFGPHGGATFLVTPPMPEGHSFAVRRLAKDVLGSNSEVLPGADRSGCTAFEVTFDGSPAFSKKVTLTLLFRNKFVDWSYWYYSAARAKARREVTNNVRPLIRH